MIEYGKNYRYRDICAIFNWVPCSGSKQRSQINILKKIMNLLSKMDSIILKNNIQKMKKTKKN